MNAVDTNILLNSIDRHERAKQLNRCCTACVRTRSRASLWQVLGELTQQLRR
jgi:hypothetical protein